MRSLFGMMIKELHQIRRDVRALGIPLRFPTVLLLFLGYIISMDIRHVPVVVFDEDGTDLSRRLVEHVTAYEHLDIAGYTVSSREMERTVFEGRAGIGIHIPRGFSDTVRAGGRAPVQAVIDGTNSLIASTASGVLRSFFHAFNMELASDSPPPASISLPGLIVPRVRLYYNPELRSSFFLIPGLVAFILALACTLSTSLSIVREKERGTIEQIILSPLPSWRFIVGKTIPYVVISVASAALILAAGHLLFDLPMRGNPLMLAASTLIYILCMISLGLLISSITDSQQVAYTISALATLLPTFLLSGFVFPIRNMPLVIQLITYVVPARYYLTILRGTLLQDAYWKILLPDLGSLALLSLGLLLLATIRIRRSGLA
ncbi:MAG: ABC transporter permease [Deltaproteobacteria bacterium]|nr:ABC transporter permease [Deltaproteobacteria bacterium]